MSSNNNIVNNIREQIKQLRQSKKISVEKLSELSGLSSLTITKIENGKSNPTINTLWKLTKCLEAPLMSLFKNRGSNVVFSTENHGYFLEDENHKWEVEPIVGQFDFEVYKVRLKANSKYYLDSQTSNTLEVITVLSGTLNLRVEHDSYIVHEHNTIYFINNNSHEYINDTNEDILMNIVVKYENL